MFRDVTLRSFNDACNHHGTRQTSFGSPVPLHQLAGSTLHYRRDGEAPWAVALADIYGTDEDVSSVAER